MIVKTSAKALVFVFGLLSAVAANAQANINEMQTCQALLIYLEANLETPLEGYAPNDVETVMSGLRGYNKHIQAKVIDPGLAAYTRGDQAAMKKMQARIDSYKLNVIEGMLKRYPTPAIKMDHLMSLDQCTKKLMPEGVNLVTIKQSFEIMVKWAQLGG